MKLAKTESETRVDKEEANAEETKSLQVIHEKNCADLKIVKADNNNLKKELDIKSVSIKTSTKDAKYAAKTHGKEFQRLETYINSLHS